MPVIPSKANRKQQHKTDFAPYRERNPVERFFLHLEELSRHRDAPRQTRQHNPGWRPARLCHIGRRRLPSLGDVSCQLLEVTGS